MANAEQLITDNLDLWSSAVKAKSSAGRGSSKKLELYGISKLRELILDLAVQGMLIQQDLNDEPASKYLERTAAAKMRSLKEKKIKKQKPLAEIDTDSTEFRLPRGWQWERLGNLVEMYNGRAFKSTEWRTDGLPIVRIQNLNDNKADFNYFQGELSDNNRISNGTFLISWSGTPGTSFGAFIWERGPAALNQHINKCEFHSNEVNLDFMRLAVNGQMNHFISKAQGGVGLKHVTKGTLNNAILGIPPLAEQKRIIAKVDELMALCDQLEREQESNLDTHKILVSTFLSALTTASADASQFAVAWQRIQSNFDTLFTTESSVDQLKQTILQLAVMGKLVQQDPEDQPASILLNEIANHYARLVSEKKAKKMNPIRPVLDSEIPLNTPPSWCWTRFKALPISYNVGLDRGKSLQGFDLLYRYFKMNNILNDGGFDLSKVTSVDASDEEVNKFKLQSGELLFNTRNSQELVGKTCVFEEDAGGPVLYNNNILCARFSVKPIAYFLDLWMRSPSGKLQLEKLKSGTTNVWAIYQGKLETLACPIPPKEEQFRIIDKVNELMALCDKLKANIASAQNTQLNLADSIVEQAIHSPT